MVPARERNDTKAVSDRTLSRFERVLLIAAPSALVAALAAGAVDWRDQAVLKRDVAATREAVAETRKMVADVVTWINERSREVGRDQEQIKDCQRRVQALERDQRVQR